MIQTGPTSHSYMSQRLKLHYADWGNAEAPPLLLVHGGRDHCRSWDWVAQQLSADWHVIAPDLRGHGDSQWAADGCYSVMDHVYDLAQLIHQMDAEQVTIVAHSLGGNISLRYTGLYPDKVKQARRHRRPWPQPGDAGRARQGGVRRSLAQMDRRQARRGRPAAANAMPTLQDALDADAV